MGSIINLKQENDRQEAGGWKKSAEGQGPEVNHPKTGSRKVPEVKRDKNVPSEGKSADIRSKKDNHRKSRGLLIACILIGIIAGAILIQRGTTVNPAPGAEVNEPMDRTLFQTLGNVVTFGTYQQTNSGNDKTPIEWIVLDVQDGKSLLLSKYGLDAQPYNQGLVDITWEKCTLRSWLNGAFMNKAFTAEEQAGIVLTSVGNSSRQGSGRWNTNGGNNTQDKIFLLSYAEANKYLGVTYGNSSNTKSRAAPTAYAIKQGVYTNSNYKTTNGAAAGWWWLRSPGNNQNYATYVGSDGSLYDRNVNFDNAVVRPAMWINLESGIF